MEPDSGGDYILYQGREQVPVIEWQEVSTGKAEDKIATVYLCDFGYKNSNDRPGENNAARDAFKLYHQEK